MIHTHRQQGGTLLGIIIGLVIGLGIALAVAMAITKTPMPFTDKSGRQKASDPGAQVTDPNRPLYGSKAPAREAAKEVAPPQNTAAPQPADKPREIQVAPAAEAPAPAKAPVVEQSASAKPALSAPAPAAADDKWIYFLQAGAFREQGDAEGMRAKLALQGVEARVSERQSESGVLYRVRVGPFSDLDAMNKVRTKLSDSGIDAAVVRAAK